MTSPLEQCRDALAVCENALEVASADIGSWGSYASSYFQQKHDLAGDEKAALVGAKIARAALAAADAALAAQKGPIATLHSDGCWTHAPGRDPLDRFSSKSRLDVYAAPVAAPVAQPLTDEQIEAAALARDNETAYVAGFENGARFAERAHGIAPKEPA